MAATTEKVTKTAIVSLTDKEKSEYGEQAAGHEMKITELEGDRKKLNAELNTHRGARHQLLKAIEEGEEERTIECEVHYDYENSIVNYMYKGDIVEQRKMEDSDRQLGLAKKEERKPKRKAIKRKKADAGLEVVQ